MHRVTFWHGDYTALTTHEHPLEHSNSQRITKYHDVGWAILVGDDQFLIVEFCPWCGRKLR